MGTASARAAGLPNRIPRSLGRAFRPTARLLEASGHACGTPGGACGTSIGTLVPTSTNRQAGRNWTAVHRGHRQRHFHGAGRASERRGQCLGCEMQTCTGTGAWTTVKYSAQGRNTLNGLTTGTVYQVRPRVGRQHRSKRLVHARLQHRGPTTCGRATKPNAEVLKVEISGLARSRPERETVPALLFPAGTGARRKFCAFPSAAGRVRFRSSVCPAVFPRARTGSCSRRVRGHSKG